MTEGANYLIVTVHTVIVYKELAFINHPIA
jgi:hypothetical protein